MLEAPETSYSMPLIIMQKSTKPITFNYGGGKCCSALIHSGKVISVYFERIRQIFKWKGETGSKHDNPEKVLSYWSWAELKIPQSCYFSKLMVKSVCLSFESLFQESKRILKCSSEMCNWDIIFCLLFVNLQTVLQEQRSSKSCRWKASLLSAFTHNLSFTPE